MPKPIYLTVPEAAELMGVTRNTVYRRVRPGGDLHRCLVLVYGRWKIDKARLDFTLGGPEYRPADDQAAIAA